MPASDKPERVGIQQGRERAEREKREQEQAAARDRVLAKLTWEQARQAKEQARQAKEKQRLEKEEAARTKAAEAKKKADDVQREKEEKGRKDVADAESALITTLAVVDKRVIQPSHMRMLVEMLRPDMKESAAKATLRVFEELVETKRDEVVAAGAVPALVQMLQAESRIVQCLAGECLREYASTPAGSGRFRYVPIVAQAAVDVGVLPALVGMLRDVMLNDNTPSPQQKAAFVISMITQKGKIHQEALRSAGSIAPLAALLAPANISAGAVATANSAARTLTGLCAAGESYAINILNELPANVLAEEEHRGNRLNDLLAALVPAALKQIDRDEEDTLLTHRLVIDRAEAVSLPPAKLEAVQLRVKTLERRSVTTNY